MYQLLAGVIVVLCFILGMNSKSISGGKEESKIPPDPGREGVKAGAALGDETTKSRDQIKSELTRLAQAPPPISSRPNAMCYDTAGPSGPAIPEIIPPSETQETAPVTVAPGNKTASPYSRDTLRGELRKLAKSTPPDRASMTSNAECYSRAPRMTDTAEYSCEKCRTKTVYSLKPSKPVKPGSDERPEGAVFDAEKITRIRRLAAQIASKKLNIYIDETGLCAKCSGGEQTGKIYAEISYQGGEKPVRTSIEPFDLDLVVAFLEGRDRVGIDGPDCAPLKDYQKRLEEIFGVTAESK